MAAAPHTVPKGRPKTTAPSRFRSPADAGGSRKERSAPPNQLTKMTKLRSPKAASRSARVFGVRGRRRVPRDAKSAPPNQLTKMTKLGGAHPGPSGRACRRHGAGAQVPHDEESAPPVRWTKMTKLGGSSASLPRAGVDLEHGTGRTTGTTRPHVADLAQERALREHFDGGIQVGYALHSTLQGTMHRVARHRARV